MTAAHDVLILGASYGSLVGTKLLLTGRDVTLVCTAPTAALINDKGTIVRLPIRGRAGPVAVHSTDTAGTLSAATPETVDPSGFDLVVLGMQEPQYGSDGVRELMERVATSGVPCVAIMNMPPPPYLERLPNISTGELARCYRHPAAWNSFDPGLVTLASPDPQAVRPAGEPKNVLAVGLPTNFKVAPFAEERHTDLLLVLQADIDALRYEAEEGAIELPVKLRVHDSIFVPLAKWPMLVAGNYRCVGVNDMTSIEQAVHSDVNATREVYDWVGDVCIALGASKGDLVPFDKYASAAKSLKSPSSAARSLAAGAVAIERVDRLVCEVATQVGMRSDELDEVVTLVDAWLERNSASSDHSA